MSQKERKFGLIVNDSALLLLLILYYVGHYTRFTPAIVTIMALSLLVTMVTFWWVHVKTGLWKLTHSKNDDLDEREIALTRSALQTAYAIFTVISLIFLLLEAVFGGIVNVVLVAALIYYAHTLPSTIIAWREKKVSTDIGR